MTTTGKDASDILAGAKSTSDADSLLWNMVQDGAVPNYIAKNWWKQVNIYGTGPHLLTILVAPDYFAVGTDADPLRVGRESPYFAQKVASRYDAIIPSRKLVNEIQENAFPRFAYTDVKAPPYSIPLALIESNAALIAANNLANKQFNRVGTFPGDDATTAIGYRKSIVVGPGLDGKKVAIYGGRWSADGSGAKNIVQDYSTIHPWNYSDYSHGIVLVSRKAYLDGSPVDIRDLFASNDPAIYGLVSDQGRFDPVFPNAGANSMAKFVATAGSSFAESVNSDVVPSVEPGASSAQTSAAIAEANKSGGDSKTLVVVTAATVTAVLAIWGLT